jgi:hypothetical protein
LDELLEHVEADEYLAARRGFPLSIGSETFSRRNRLLPRIEAPKLRAADHRPVWRSVEGHRVHDGAADGIDLPCRAWPGQRADGREGQGLSQLQLNAIARHLNERPRKTLGFHTPAEMFSECVALTD